MDPYTWFDNNGLHGRSLVDLHSNPECCRILYQAFMLQPHKKLVARFNSAYVSAHYGSLHKCKPLFKYHSGGW